MRGSYPITWEPCIQRLCGDDGQGTLHRRIRPFHLCSSESTVCCPRTCVCVYAPGKGNVYGNPVEEGHVLVSSRQRRNDPRSFGQTGLWQAGENMRRKHDAAGNTREKRGVAGKHARVKRGVAGKNTQRLSVVWQENAREGSVVWQKSTREVQCGRRSTQGKRSAA